MAHGYLFIESGGFSRVVLQHFGSDDAYREFQAALMERPDRGPVIPGAAPLRKARWAEPGRKKGKRGGLRVIYIHVPDMETFYLLDVYAKDESDDLSGAVKTELQRLARRFVEDLRENAAKETKR
jgi:mRNA-degrading endonuclease RelE of RelBE toxin-antitoxin system